MAENKKSFLLYCDTYMTVKKLTDQQAGRLFKIILSYVNDENPIVDNQIIDLVFEPIKQQLKRDLKRYESICERNRINGEKGGRPTIKKPKKTKENPNKPSGLFTNPKKPDNDSDTDNDNDIDNGLKKTDFLTKIITAFQQSYFDIFGIDYVLMSKGKERAAASKIIQLYKTKYPDANSEKTINDLSIFFTSCCMIQDSWMQKNMSLSLIVSKFNEINNLLKNGKTVKTPARNVGAIVEAVFAAHGK